MLLLPTLFRVAQTGDLV